MTTYLKDDYYWTYRELLPRKNGTYRLEVEKGRYRDNFTNIVECFETVEARDKWLARNIKKILKEGYSLASNEKIEEAKSKDWSIGEILWVEDFGKTLERVGNLKISKFYDPSIGFVLAECSGSWFALRQKDSYVMTGVTVDGNRLTYKACSPSYLMGDYFTSKIRKLRLVLSSVSKGQTIRVQKFGESSRPLFDDSVVVEGDKIGLSPQVVEQLSALEGRLLDL